MEGLINQGESVTLSNGKEYFAFSTLEQGEKTYVFLMTTTQPVEVCFAEQKLIDGQPNVRIIEDRDEKIAVLQLFQATHKK